MRHFMVFDHSIAIGSWLIKFCRFGLHYVLWLYWKVGLDMMGMSVPCSANSKENG